MKSLPIKELIVEKISGEWGADVSGNQSSLGVAIVRTANFSNTGKIDFSNIVRRDIDEKKVDKKRLISGDIIIEKSGGSPNQPVGRVVLFENPDEDTYLCNNFTTILRPNRELIYPEYLFYALFYNHQKGKTLRYQNKTTGIINLKLDNYLESEIPLPTLEDQKRIAHLLGKVEGLIDQRKQHLQQLDALMKSVFLKMFGDPVRNEKRWKQDRIGRSVKVQGGYAFKSKDLVNKGTIRLVKIANVHFEKLIWDDVSFVPDRFYDDHKRFSLHEGDLLIALTRPVIKSLDVVKTATVRKSDLPCLLNQRVARFVLNKSQINPKFLLHYCYMQFFKDTVEKLCPPGLQPNISTNQIEDIPIYYPPINLQDEFATIVKKVEVIKSLYQQSLFELKNLYAALSQRAFKGELDVAFAIAPKQLPDKMEGVPPIIKQKKFTSM